MHLRIVFSCALLLVTVVSPPLANASSKAIHQVYIVYLGEKHDDPSMVTASHHDLLTSVLGSKAEALKSIVYSYKHGFSGFAAMLTESQAETLAEFPQVINVNPNTYHQVHTTRSWDFLGLDYKNNHQQQPSLLRRAKYGEDVIIGVIDTGIWPESPSFEDNGYGSIPERWRGTCQTGQSFDNTKCNRKIIGARCCNEASLASRNVTGKFVMCYAPEAPPGARLHTAIYHTMDAGAKGLIFAQHANNELDTLDECDGIMPCVLVDFEIAERILSYWGITGKPVVKVSPAVTVVGDGVSAPRVASFSSRGPSPLFPGTLKPDISAPGVIILAAMRGSYQLMSGTSMACPHVSAVTGLLKSVHPDWSPAMLKSAIVTTASFVDLFGMPIQAEGAPRKLADPFDFGGGNIDPDRAADPGLVYDVDAGDYIKFVNCTQHGSWLDDCELNQRNLNLPSIAVPNLKDYVTVRRTVMNVGPLEATYRVEVEAPAGVAVSVEPSVINFTRGASRSITFVVAFTARQRVQGGYVFGSLIWRSNGSAHSVRIPVAVRTVIQDFVADTS
ncbi:hypothetical protein VPH35_092171 [Triticum aestivum]